VIRGLACTYKAVEVTAQDRLACIKVADRACTIVEAVPDNDRGRADAATRGERDVRELRAAYTRDANGLLSRFPALRRCELAGELQITASVAQYPACAKLDLGDPFAEVPADPQ
jgi:hypothetical protein